MHQRYVQKNEQLSSYSELQYEPRQQKFAESHHRKCRFVWQRDVCTERERQGLATLARRLTQLGEHPTPAVMASKAEKAAMKEAKKVRSPHTHTVLALSPMPT